MIAELLRERGGVAEFHVGVPGETARDRRVVKQKLDKAVRLSGTI